jgi:hypothetical protein
MNFNVAVSREGWEKKKTTWYRAAKFGNDISILPFKKGTKVFYLENLILTIHQQGRSKKRTRK